MSRALAASILLVLAAPSGCAKQGAPEQVADAFAEAYFRRADQEKAKEYTALGASEMMDRELRDVAQVRKEGYTQAEAAGGEVTVRRGVETRREQRIRFAYEIVVKAERSETVREADVELASIGGAWKVVRVGLKQR